LKSSGYRQLHIRRDARPQGVIAYATIENAGKLNAIIFADTDFLHDQFWVDERDFLGQKIQIPLAHNATFVVNAIENLTGGEALRDLRGRGVKQRPFKVVDDIRRDAERQFREKEQSLEAKLKETQAKLAGIEQRGGEGGNVILTDKDRETIEKFRTEMLSVRRELPRGAILGGGVRASASARSHSVSDREPGQVREEAALSGSIQAQWGHLAEALARDPLTPNTKRDT